jgi:hypothetical protein
MRHRTRDYYAATRSLEDSCFAGISISGFPESRRTGVDVLVFVLLLPGAVFLYDAVAHPLTADAGQVLIGSVLLVRERR